jgi:hypothetical protein
MIVSLLTDFLIVHLIVHLAGHLAVLRVDFAGVDGVVWVVGVCGQNPSSGEF